MNQTTSQTTLGELGFILVHVPDVAAARGFYVETLGLTVETETPGFLTFARPAGAGATFAVGQGEATPSGVPAPELWWVVADVDALHTALIARNVPIVSAPKDEPFGRALEFTDPAGNVVRVYQSRGSADN
jgi:catechol 2,3-dioxygenase-like lactoylglutathione lyase family enzyme